MRRDDADEETAEQATTGEETTGTLCVRCWARRLRNEQRGELLIKLD